MGIFDWIRLILGCLFMICGLVIFFTEIFGIFHFHYVLNRMHAAAMGDTRYCILYAGTDHLFGI